MLAIWKLIENKCQFICFFDRKYSLVYLYEQHCKLFPLVSGGYFVRYIDLCAYYEEWNENVEAWL
jgi:hypothetical protein